MTVSIRLDGFQEFQRALDELSKSTARGVLRRTGMKAMKPMLTAARAIVPERTGLTKGSLTLKSIGDRGGPVVIAFGVEGKAGSLAHLVEFGTYTAAAHPFLTPAFEETKEQVIREVTVILRDEIAKTQQRVARRRARAAAGR